MKRLGVVAIAVFVFAELVARVAGVGNPPLLVADPEIEYLYKPSSAYKRLGNVISYNAYSMRSREVPSDSDTFRVLVLGDSVINGGSRLTQDDVVTVVLERELAATLGKNVFVGNISAESWGPHNLLAYVKRFGLFNADRVVLVLNSEDYGDVPTFNVELQTSAPILAIEHLASRFIPRGQRLPPTDRAKAESVSALLELVAITNPIVVQHLRADEAPNVTSGYRAIREAVPGAITWPSRREHYSDNIHLNAAGHKALAAFLAHQVTSSMSLVAR